MQSISSLIKNKRIIVGNKLFLSKIASNLKQLIDPKHRNETLPSNTKRKVFCIGANKTGTTSLELALKELGLSFGNQREVVLAYVKNINNWEDDVAIFCEKYEAFQDVPFSLGENYVVLDKMFPGSKFILSVRDSADQWYQSLVKFHSKVFNCASVPPRPSEIEHNFHLEYMNLLDFVCTTFGTSKDDPYNKEVLVAHYNNRNQKIIDYFKDRPDDLLVVNVSSSEDYKRLKSFLLKAPHRSTFPHENKTDTNEKRPVATESGLDDEIKTEVIIPISITQGFINQIKLAYYSMRMSGFFDNGFRLNVVYAGDERQELFAEYTERSSADHLIESPLERKFINWAKLNPHIRLFKVSREFMDAQYPTAFSHCNYRYHVPLSRSCQSVILCDADTVFLNYFEPAKLLGGNELAIAGHMVHFPPPIFSSEANTLISADEKYWSALFDRLGLDKEHIKHNCSISNRNSGLQAPNYNYGFVVLTPKMLELLSWHYNSYFAKIQNFARTPMASQIAVTAIGIYSGATFVNLPGCYNAANDEEHWTVNNIDSASVKVLHYLREDEFQRETFLNPENIDNFILSVSSVTGNRLLKEHVKLITDKYGKKLFS